MCNGDETQKSWKPLLNTIFAFRGSSEWFAQRKLSCFMVLLRRLFANISLLSRQQNLSHISLRKQIMNLIRRIHNRTNRCRMIHRINDQCKELTHICFNEIRFIMKLRRQIGQIGCDQSVQIALFIIFIELVKTFCEETKSSTYKYTLSTAVF